MAISTSTPGAPAGASPGAAFGAQPRAPFKPQVSAPVNVLIIVNSLCFGGAEKHAVTLFNTLDPHRFRVSLVYLKDDSSLLPQLQGDRVQGSVFCAGVSRKIDMRAAQRIADHLCDEAIDVVLCTNTYSLLYGWLASMRSTGRMARRPRIVEIFHSTELGSIEDELQMLFYRPWVLAADRLVYVCDNQRRYWRKRALRARADTVIHNGIDICHFSDRYSAEEKARLRASYGFGPDDYVIGLCAAMRPEKAHDDLLQAVARLRTSGVPARALLIGDGPQRKAIEAEISERGLEQHVRITGFADDVRPLIAACDVMTITSHHVETFSIAALEAMALGKPMVMTDIGGAAEQVRVGRNGYLYRRGDIAALTDALRKLSACSPRRDMGIQARATVVHRFSLDRMVGSYASLLDSLVPKDDLQPETRHAA